MAKTTIISSISRNTTYPVTQTISAPNNCGMLILKVDDSITDQMIYELPNINVTIYTTSNIKIKSFDINLTTFSSDKRNISKKKQYAIPIYNIPNSCIISIKPLFDNNAISSHNQLIDNGIIDSSKWDSITVNFNIAIYFDDSAVKSGIHSDVELWPETTITGIPPISFRANGDPLISWSMLGNGQQSGTPTPDAPIMPEFVGVRTGNLFDMATVENGKSISLDGSITTYPKRCSTVTPIDVSTYSNITLAFTTTLSRTRIIYALFNDSTLVTRQAAVSSGSTIDVSSGNKLYICFYDTLDTETVQKSDLSNVMLNTGSTALPYEPYGYKIPITCGGQTVPVYLGQTQTVRRIGKLILTGEETIAGSTLSGGWIVTNLPVNMVNTTGFITAICTHYKAVSNAAMTSLMAGDMCISTNSTNRINFAPNISTAADFKAYLAAQYAAGTPVTVWYVLETPETAIVNEPLCKIGDYADELHSTDAGVTIPTVKGVNTLTVDTELQPSEMSLTGKIKQ